MNPYGGVVRHSVIEKNNFAAVIDCPNHKCYGGGFQVDVMLHGMVMQKQTEHEETRSCGGYEGSAKGRRNYGICGHYFKVKAIIKYKDSEAN